MPEAKSMSAKAEQKPRQRRFNGFDYFILSGGVVNLAVIVLLLGYWLFTL